MKTLSHSIPDFKLLSARVINGQIIWWAKRGKEYRHGIANLDGTDMYGAESQRLVVNGKLQLHFADGRWEVV